MTDIEIYDELCKEDTFVRIENKEQLEMLNDFGLKFGLKKINLNVIYICKNLLYANIYKCKEFSFYKMIDSQNFKIHGKIYEFNELFGLDYIERKLNEMMEEINKGPTPEFPQEIELQCKSKNLFNGGIFKDGVYISKTKDLVIPTPYEPYPYVELKYEEEKKMGKILNIYYERMEEKIDKEYDEKIIELRNNDEIQQVIKEMNEQINTILENDNKIAEIHPKEINIEYDIYTTKTLDKEKELLEEKQKALKELNNTIEEIDALFNLTDDYNERMKILKNYNIVNKQGKLVF